MSNTTTILSLAAASFLFATAAQAQAPADNAAVRGVLATLKADNAWTLAQQRSICEIPAPSFKEATRAAEMKRRFEALGLKPRIDAEGNVIAERAGAAPGPTVVLAGHLDTVFPEGTDVKVKQDGPRLHSPGIGDDCRGLAVVLAVARAYQQHHVNTAGRVIFVANVGEEGPGDLRGTRHLFNKEYAGKIDYFISVDGIGTNFKSRAVGSHRYRVTYKGPGGHSYGAFGMPNPIHALGRAIALIGDLQVPKSPKTTFNVGLIKGGTSVNSIAFEATMDVDMRSESAVELDAIDAKIRRAVHQALDAENARWPESAVRLTVQVDTIGMRPTGAQADTARIVRVAIETGRALGFSPEPGAASTDANYPISLGLPGITIDGGGRGGGAHALDEWYEDGPNGWLGPQWAALIVATLAGVR
jgi:tripeptide aminopeptidase